MNARPPHVTAERNDGWTPIVEREHELSALLALLRDADQGTGGVILLEGPVGIGKSLLLRRLAREAGQEGLRVLEAHCDTLERDFPFGLVRHLFGPLFRSLHAAERERLLAGNAQAAMQALSSKVFSGDAMTTTEDVSYAVLHGLYWFTCNLAEVSPLVIVVDDAHSADVASLRFLAHLARRIEGMPVILALSRRTGDPGTDPALFEEVISQPRCRILRPQPLTESGVATMVEATLRQQADSDFYSSCLAATGGIPLLVRALLTVMWLHGDLPTKAGLEYATAQGGQFFQEAVLCVLRRQPESVPAAQALAVIGDNASPEVCARLAGLSEPALLSSMRTLRSNGLMTASDDGTAWSFNHGQIREVILAQMRPDELADAHHRAARLLLDLGAPAEQVSAHLLMTELPATEDWAVSVLLEAAKEASSRGAPRLAVDLLRPCLRGRIKSATDVAVLIELGFAETAVDVHASVRHLRLALEHVEDPVQRFRVVTALASNLVHSEWPQEAVRVLAEQASTLDDPGGDLARCLKAQRLMASLEDLRTLRAAFDEAPLDLGLPGNTPGERALLAALARVNVVREELAEASVAAARRMLERSVPNTDSPLFQTTAAMVLLYGGHPGEADTAYQRILDSAWQSQSLLSFSLSTGMRAEAAYRLGALAGALAGTMTALYLAPRDEWCHSLILPVATQIHALLESGDLSGAEAIAAQGFPPSSADSWQWNEFMCARGRLNLERGDARAALADLLECGTRQHQWNRTSPAVSSWWVWAAEAHQALGSTDEARALAEDAVERARRGGLRDALGAALRLLAELEPGPGKLDLLEEALTVLEESPSQLERARVLIDFGAALHDRDRIPAAREALHRGLDLAHTMGARPLRSRAHEALLATGARPRRVMSQGLQSLTPSESQVARLTAEGGTNREVAEALFVTQRTVEMHLTSVYRKLGVAGRRELRAFFGGSTADTVPENGYDDSQSADWARAGALW
ncbi:AAA family ATPase [Streptomyces sp. NPDC051776]|uniref:ATP-binding protein n=1 Tax=Streptomyces sp. NPDC051776 TaxID=3155414 RepID=UPI00341BA62D